MAEFHDDVGIHDRDGTSEAFERDWTATCKPEEDCESYKESDWTGLDAIRT